MAEDCCSTRKHSSAGMSVRLTRERSGVRAPLLPFLVTIQSDGKVLDSYFLIKSKEYKSNERKRKKTGNFTAGIQYPFRIWDRNLWQGKLSFCGFSGEVRQQVVADPAARTYRIRRLSLSVVFHFCGEPLLYRSGASDRRRAFDEGDL